MKKPLIKIVQNSVWLISDKIGKIIVKLIASIFIANYLGSELFGSISYSISLVAIFFSFSSLGLNGIVVNELIKQPLTKEKIIINSLWMKLIASVLSFALVWVFIFWYASSETVSWFVIIIAIGSTFKFFEIIDYWFQASLNSKIAVISRFSALIIISIVQLLCVYFELDAIYIVYAIASEFLLIGCFYFYFFLKEAKIVFEFDIGLSLALLKKSWPLILSAIGAIIYLKSDQIMIEYFLDQSSVGVYAVAVQFSEIWYFIPTSIAVSLFPLLVSKSKESSFKDLMIGFYAGMFILGIIVAVCVTFFGPYIIRLFYNKEYWSAGNILIIHIWAGVFIFMRAIFSKWLIIKAKYIHSLTSHLFGALTNVILNLFMIPKYGITGAAVATLISYGFSSYFTLWLIPSLREAAIQMTWGMIRPIHFFKIALRYVKASN